MVKSFYENALELMRMRGLSTPSTTDLEKVIGIIKDDEELTRYFYDKNERGALSVGWLELLNGAGEFEELERKEGRIVERVKALYLVDCASVKPKVVLGIVKKVEARDPWIQGKMIEAILAMEDESVQGISIVMKYLGERDYKVWYFIGEPAAKLMVKLVDKHPKEAFEVSRTLLDVWRPGEREAGVFETIRGKFDTHEYKELIFKYYNRVWEKRPLEATGVMVEIYDEYLEACKKEKGYDISEYLGVSVEDLENIQRLEYDLDAIIMKAICEGGRVVIKKEPNKISRLLDDLEKRNKGIFNRVTMYLLRFVPAGMEKDRINKIIANNEFLEKPGYEYEYKLLLKDQYDEIDGEIINEFVQWVKNIKKNEDERKEIEEWCKKNEEELPDFDKMDNYIRAEELYLVRDKFQELYQEYVRRAGVDDESKLAPRKMVGEARFVSPKEGTPLTSDEMAEKSVEQVLDYVSNPKNYEESKKKQAFLRDAASALRATFKEDVKKRPKEYLKCDMNKLKELPPSFLVSFFYGVEDAVRGSSFNKEEWDLLINFASLVIKERHEEQEYEDCFSEILSVLREGFGGGKGKLEFDESTAKKFCEIVKRLIHFPVEDTNDKSEERDPVQLLLSQVAGKAMELTVLLGLVCKKQYEKYWEKELKGEMRECWEYVLGNIKKPGINCIFGMEFSRIYWLDKGWVKGKLDLIFSKDLWDEVWGTYTSWGRPSADGFKLLVEKGKYEQAVNMLRKKNEFNFGKNPEDGLVEHLMVGYFNGWVRLEDSVLVKFYEKAEAKLRGKAARFMTTGFKAVKEDKKPYEDIAERMRTYWKSRLEALEENAQENKEEAVELTGWVEDSLLPAKETLELLEQSLDLSDGRIGKMRDARNFVKGVCNLAKGNELLALRCLKKAVADENMHMPWARIQNPLAEFLEAMVESPENIRSEVKEVADLYGRYNPEKFRGVWEKL